MGNIPIKEVDVIAPNFKKRLSGVTTTIVQLIPLQRALGTHIAAISPKGGLPENLTKISGSSLFGLWKAPRNYRCRVWHARRNIEMAAGIFMRDILRMKIKIIFTSASQRHHTRYSKYLIQKMDKVIATSARGGSYLDVPYQVIMHGINVDEFTPPEVKEDNFASAGFQGKYAIGCFGRIRHQKGTDLFIDSMIELLPHYPEWTAVFAGRATTEHKTYLEEQIQKIKNAGLEDRIIYLGEIKIPDMRKWYKRLTLYVAPSRHEGFGLTPLEAFASQTASIASDAGAYPELIPEGTGKVVPADNQNAMQNAIEYYFSAPEKAIKAGEAGLKHVRAHFPLEREAKALNQVYKDLLEN